MKYLFTTPSCPYCPAAKKLMEEKNQIFTLVDASKKEGYELAKKYQVMRVPTLIITDTTGTMVLHLSGIDEITEHQDTLCSSPVFKN